MEGRFDWHQPAQKTEPDSLWPAPDRIGWWTVISLTAAIALHLVLFVTLGHFNVSVGWNRVADAIATEPVVVRAVEEDEPQQVPPSPDQAPAPNPERITLLDDVEILQQLKDPDLEMKPDVEVASFDVNLQSSAPAIAGDPAGDAIDVASAVDIAAENLESLGETATLSPTVAEGQMIVDPGSEVIDDEALDSFMKDLIKKGNRGDALNGKLDGVASLEEMIGLPENVLVTKTTMLPGDLLFEYNRADLRDSSKVGMQKIALLMDLNPKLHCWIEGHSDLIGSDAFNDELSQRRAESVKTFLVGIGMDASHIHTRGIGKRQPLVTTGTQQEQSLNRRVEIKLRKSPPPAADAVIPVKQAPRATPIPEEPMPAAPTAPPPAVRVKPMRALPLEEEPVPSNPPGPSAPLKAIPADEPQPGPLKATAVEE
jgi:outer membrane protein OmpA-like peptidoglycan-associated protein